MGLLSDAIGGTPSARSKRIGLHRVFEGIETSERDDIGAGKGAFGLTGDCLAKHAAPQNFSHLVQLDESITV
jgi:hypothetical protein